MPDPTTSNPAKADAAKADTKADAILAGTASPASTANAAGKGDAAAKAPDLSRVAASGLNDRQKAEAVRRRYPDRPEVTAEVERGVDVVVYKDNQGRELSVDRFSPGVFAEFEEGEGEGEDR